MPTSSRLRHASLIFVAAAVSICAAPVRAGELFAVDGEAGILRVLDPTSGADLGALPLPEPPSGGPDGLAASGDALYYVNALGSNQIYRLDPETGAVLGRFPAPLSAGGADALAFDGDVLLSLDPTADVLFRVDPTDGTVLSSCKTGQLAVAGLAAEDGRVFAVTGLTQVFELDAQTCEIVSGPWSVPGGELLLSLAFDGTYLYGGGFLGRTILVMDPETGALVQELPVDFMATGIGVTTEAPPSSTLEALVDVRPGTCRNPFSMSSRGMVPVALLGGEDFDIGQVDLESVVLEGVAPARWRVMDVESCEPAGPDGWADVMFWFPAEALSRALEEADPAPRRGTVVEVTLSGSMVDGTAFQASDSVRIVGGGSSKDSTARNRR